MIEVGLVETCGGRSATRPINSQHLQKSSRYSCFIAVAIIGLDCRFSACVLSLIKCFTASLSPWFGPWVCFVFVDV